MKFSDKLAKMRKANNLSQEQLADALGVTRQSVSKWESGDSYPDMGKIIQICKILNCTLNDIMDDDVMSDAPLPQSDTVKKEEKQDFLKKAFNEFLDYVTRIVNMVTHMSGKTRFKMIIEMAFVAAILILIANLLGSVINSLLWNVCELLPRAARNGVNTIFDFIVNLALIVLGYITFIQVFKVRYLDYYVTLPDNNAKQQSVETPIEENKSSFKKEKEPIVIIRDPNHSGSKFLEGLGNFIIVILKIVLCFIALPIILAFVAAIAAAIFCLFHAGIIYKSFLFFAIGSALFAGIIIFVLYNIIFKRKQNYRLIIIVILVSLIMTGIGGGFVTQGITKLNVVDDYKTDEMIEEVVTLNDIKENDTLYVDSNNIDFVIDENMEGIKFEFSYPKYSRLYTNEFVTQYGTEFYYGLLGSDQFSLKSFIADLDKNQIHDTYYLDDYFYVRITCNSALKEKFENRG